MVSMSDFRPFYTSNEGC